MSRLTKKDYKNGIQANGYYTKKNAQRLTDISHKLGQLEDIEDEFGCPLDVVFKSMIDYGVVEYKIRDEIVIGSISSIYKSVGGKWCGKFIPKRYILGTGENYATNIELNQYQKTWWLKGDKDEQSFK